MLDVQTQSAFNHALYLFVGHWAAYVATLGLLATFGIILSTTTTVHHREMCYGGVILGLLMSWYFLWGMLEFWNLMDASNLLLPNYQNAVPFLLRPQFSGPIGGVVSLFLAAGNYWLLWKSAK